MRALMIIPLTALLMSACASPPLPELVPWASPGIEVNGALPQWHENSAIIPSASVSDHWSVVFSPDVNVRTPEEYYAVAHASRVVVTAPGTTDWFRAKRWLRQHGASGVIEWQPPLNCPLCQETRIDLSR